MYVLRHWHLAYFLAAPVVQAVLQSQAPFLGRNVTQAIDMPLSLGHETPVVIRAEKHHCEDIHEAEDPCEYARLYCSPKSAGMIDYITWYYCDMQAAQPLAFSILVAWTSLLFSTIGIASSDFFCPNLATIANSLGMSQSVAGVTFLAFGNGSPDVFSTFAAFKAHSGSLAIGELLGAAAFITSVVAGVMAIIAPFKVSRRSFLRDAGFFLIAVIMTMILLADGKLRLWESIVMIVFYCSYVAYVLIGTYIHSSGDRKKIIDSRVRSRYEPVRSGTVIDEDDLDSDASRLLAEDRVGIDNLEAQDSDDDSAEHDYQDLNTSMSITGRPMHTSRNSVRPSLLGALEFRELVTGLAEDGSLSPATLKAARKRPRAHSHANRPMSDSMMNRRTQSYRVDVTKDRQFGADSKEDSGRRQASMPDKLESEDITAEHLSRSSSRVIPSRSQSQSTNRSEEPIANADIASTSLRLHNPIELLSPSIPTRTIPSPVPVIQIDGEVLDADEGHSITGTNSPRVPDYEAMADTPPLRSAPNRDSDLSEDTANEPSHEWESEHIPSWWPTSYLPTPGLLKHLLFPTLQEFRSQSHFQRLLSVLALPSVFALTVTLPVVNPPINQDQAEANEAGRDLEAIVAKDDAERYTAHQGWNRWLACVQCILTPLLVTLFIFDPTSLLVPLLCAAGISIVLLCLVLFFTSPDQRPRFHTLLCFVGFAVSVCWISTIANEVVGTLQAFGTILGLSDAILGLTVFAVGNSLGDFVADVTVARMGFSQMAISGVFGGPMLNILLGIGISGIYINVSKHHVYNTEISPTLIVSGASLLTTLIILLIAVPANSYVMSRKLGVALCCIFLLGMISSVLVEIYMQS